MYINIETFIHRLSMHYVLSIIIMKIMHAHTYACMIFIMIKLNIHNFDNVALYFRLISGMFQIIMNAMIIINVNH